MITEMLEDGSTGLTAPSGRQFQVDTEHPDAVFVVLHRREAARMKAGGPEGVSLSAQDVAALAHWLRTERGVVYP